MSWGPFAEGRNNFFQNETLQKIGEKHHKTVAQTALRFLIQENVVVIPKSVHKERMEQNFDIFDFNLSAGEMETIRRLDTENSLFFLIMIRKPLSSWLIIKYRNQNVR